MFDDDELKQISALQHLMFCKRQCYLAYIELIWVENKHTTEGHVFHERVHGNESGFKNDVYIVRGISLVSKKFGITGQADAVEFHQANEGHILPNKNGFWRPYPIEYKKGKPKTDSCDEVQLCAQALCLEEKYNIQIVEGALFYGEINRRSVVVFNESLRNKTINLIQELHELYKLEMRPKPIYSKKCEQCSLKDECLPETFEKKSALDYIKANISALSKD